MKNENDKTRQRRTANTANTRPAVRSLGLLASLAMGHLGTAPRLPTIVSPLFGSSAPHNIDNHNLQITDDSGSLFKRGVLSRL